MLLLALLPTAGRLSRAPHAIHDGVATVASNTESGFGAICSARGLTYDAALAAREADAFGSIRTDAFSPRGIDDEPRNGGRGDPFSPHADDCDYCGLVGSTALATTVAFLPHVRPAGALAPRITRGGAPSGFRAGLGARGPPNA